MIPVLQVSVEYDSKYDILYLIVNDPVIAEAVKVAKDVYVRRDKLTERVAGAIIEDYSTKNKECLSEILPIGLGNYLPSLY
jgi:uncharacterized protein YuzE